jgi:hypothetical protein
LGAICELREATEVGGAKLTPKYCRKAKSILSEVTADFKVFEQVIF